MRLQSCSPSMSVEDAPLFFCLFCFLYFLLNVMHEIQKAYLYRLDSCSNLVGLCDNFLFVCSPRLCICLSTAGLQWGSSGVC